MHKIKGVIVGILAFVTMATYAQSIVVTGKVVDSEGYEVIGGSVTLKGAAGVGTVTNVDGNYSLKVNNASKDVLVFSYVMGRALLMLLWKQMLLCWMKW